MSHKLLIEDWMNEFTQFNQFIVIRLEVYDIIRFQNCSKIFQFLLFFFSMMFFLAYSRNNRSQWFSNKVQVNLFNRSV